MSDEKPPAHRRYRLIFLFHSPITSIGHYHQILLALAKEFPIIPPVERSPAQPVFGNARDGVNKFHICGNILSLKDYPFTPPVEAKTKSQSQLSFDDTLPEFLRRHNIAYEESKEAGKYFIECPYKASHTGGSTARPMRISWTIATIFNGLSIVATPHVQIEEHGRHSGKGTESLQLHRHALRGGHRARRNAAFSIRIRRGKASRRRSPRSGKPVPHRHTSVSTQDACPLRHSLPRKKSQLLSTTNCHS